MWPHCGVIVSNDPVAADSVGLDILNERRRQMRLFPAVGDQAEQIRHLLRGAASRGLGTDDQDYITLLEAEHPSDATG